MTKDITLNDLARMVADGFHDTNVKIAALRNETRAEFDNVRAELRKINNRLDSVDTYVVQQRTLVRILRDKKVLTALEAQELGVA